MHWHHVLAHGNILYGRMQGEYPEGSVYIAGLGEAMGSPFGGGVPVAQTAHDQLSGTGDGDTGYLFYTFFHIAEKG